MKKLSLITILIIGFTFTSIAQRERIEISYQVNPNKSVDFYYKKNAPGSYSIFVEFPNLVNASHVPKPIIIKNLTGKFLTLTPFDDRKGINFSYNYTYIKGEVNPKVDKDFIYTLPFRNGQVVTPVQLINLGNEYFGSEIPKNWMVYQLKSPTANIITASRKGIVTKVINTHEYVSGAHFTSKKNYIVIEHSDGTSALYEGFAKDKILVKVGEKVLPYTPIGELGNEDGKQFYSLIFSISYLGDVDFKNIKKQTLANRKSSNIYLTPIFNTTDGNLKLQENKKYSSEYYEKILTSEMSKREKRKWKKKNKN